MPWNWELADWPKFTYDPEKIAALERQFLLGIGKAWAYLKTIDENEYSHFMVEILSTEGLESSKIEGEILDRESLQSSIKQHFGLHAEKKRPGKESQMAELLCNVYESFNEPLTHEMLAQWHAMLFRDSSDIHDIGKYRTHQEPMQIVSNKYGSPVVFFEAPPSGKVPQEMEAFVRWFNASPNGGSILGRAAIAHLYFENIHPFEDGNGRLGRVLAEKILSQGVGRPTLIAISKLLEYRKKEYYAALEKCNRSLDAQQWVEFFAQVVLQAHEESMHLLCFLIEKAKMFSRLSGQINERQMKVLLRLFNEGPEGFEGGLSAKNYISITKTTRATATRDLTDLVQKGALLKTGELKYTRYRLNVSPLHF